MEYPITTICRHLKAIALCIVLNCLVLVVILLVVMTGAHATDPNGTYANSPLHQWYLAQYNKHGGSCCYEADGQPYWGDYTINKDGSVTLHQDDGDTLIEEWKVLTTSNPTGHSIWWHAGVSTYCFSIGPQI